MKALLDTNAYTALLRGDERVAGPVREAEAVLMSAVVVGELLFGFRHGSHYAENRRQLEAFLARPAVTFLPVSFTTADRFGRIASALRRKGRPIPQNDLWIAAHALETGADLFSSDPHFDEVDGLVRRAFDAAAG